MILSHFARAHFAGFPWWSPGGAGGRRHVPGAHHRADLLGEPLPVFEDRPHLEPPKPLGEHAGRWDGGWQQPLKGGHLEGAVPGVNGWVMAGEYGWKIAGKHVANFLLWLHDQWAPGAHEIKTLRCARWSWKQFLLIFINGVTLCGV